MILYHFRGHLALNKPHPSFLYPLLTRPHPRGTPTFPSRFHLTLIHTILPERFGVFPGKAYMLEIAAIVFIVITVPLWFPLVISVLSFMVALVIRLLSFGFMMVFWLVLIAVVIFLLLT